MSRETLKDFFAANSIQGDSVSFSHDSAPTPDGSGNLTSLRLDGQEDIKIDPNTGKPLLDFATNNSLLGDYLEFLTRLNGNSYQIERGVKESVPGDRGNDLKHADGTGAKKVFISQEDPSNVNFSTYSNSQFEDLKAIVDKIGSEDRESMNHELLSSIEGTGTNSSGGITNQSGDESNVTQAVQNDILARSRFGNIPQKTVFIKNENESEFESKENLKINKSFGSYYDSDTLIRMEQLKSLGASLLMKASGYDTKSTPGDANNPDSLESSMGSNANMPDSMLNSPDTKVDGANIRAKNAYGFPSRPRSGESIRSGRGAFLEGQEDSFGTSYNTGLYANGKNHKMHKIKAALSLLALKSLVSQMYTQIFSRLSESTASSDIINAIKEEVTNFDDMSMYLGRARSMPNLKLAFMKDKLLVPTTYNYITALKRGLFVLFNDDVGIGTSTSGPSALLTAYQESAGVSSSPAFWYAVANSAMKSYSNTLDHLNDLLTQSSEARNEEIDNFIQNMSSNNILRFMNAIATVGDASLQAFGGQEIGFESFKNRPRNVDNLPDGPGTRVGKSRKNTGYKTRELAWSQNDVPSAYLLPLNVLRAAGRLDKIATGPNPFTAMIGSELVEQTYFSKNMDGTGNRIPKEVVKTLEDQLNAEYVPFYFQDLRTNEIISFHAFLDQLTDTITPSYNSSTGYGRVDPVRIYNSTTRSISVSFTVMATSKKDFNTMWYKINKFVTLLYPQWSKGSLVSNAPGSTFIQPNSQVLSASPLVRMRIGDVIKSNYSRFNLARMFGIGEPEVNPIQSSAANTKFELIANAYKIAGRSSKLTFENKIKDVSINLIALLYGSPIQYTKFNWGIGGGVRNLAMSKAAGAITSVLSNSLKNGFVNPMTLGLVASQLQDPNAVNADGNGGAGDALSGNIATKLPGIAGKGDFINSQFPVYLNANYNSGYKIIDEGLGRIMIPKPIKVQFISSRDITNDDISVYSNGTNDLGKTRKIYTVKIVDFSIDANYHGIELECNPSDIYQMPNDTLLTTLEFGLLLLGSGGVINPLLDTALSTNAVKGVMNSTGLAPLVDVARILYMSEESKFMEPANNPTVRAYESTQGRGLAGVIGAVNFNWLDDTFNWEIDNNSRAPMGCKISFSFDVIHDIAPGLDHSGYNRAPVYNVGDIMSNISGDVYEDFTKETEFKFRKAANSGISVTGKKK